jgi:hypothetical protein
MPPAPGNRCCNGPGSPGIIEPVEPVLQPATPAPEGPATQGAVGAVGDPGDAGARTECVVSAVFVPVATALQPAACRLAVLAAQGAACAAVVAANSRSATTQPLRVDNQGVTIAAERGRLAERLATDIRRSPLRDWRRARVDATQHGWRGGCRDRADFWRRLARFHCGLTTASCARELNASLTTGDYDVRLRQFPARTASSAAHADTSGRGDF